MWYLYVSAALIVFANVVVFIATANSWDKASARLIGCLLSTLVLGVVLAMAATPVLRLTTGFWPDYSVGTREGYITKVALKGVVYKTWEASMQIGTGAQASLQEPFAFSVPEHLAPSIEANLGNHVRITYSQYLMMPWRYGETEYLVTKVEVLP